MEKEIEHKQYVIARETIDFIIKDRKYELAEMEPTGAYIIDESGEEGYYHYTSFEVC